MLGWSRFDDRYALWHRKHGLLPEDDGSDDRRDAGLFLEEGILRWYRQRTRRMVLTPGHVGSLLRQLENGRPQQTIRDMPTRDLVRELHATYRVHYGPDLDGRLVLVSRRIPWLAVSPDAFALHESRGWGFVDAKNIEWDRAWERGAKVPAEYSCQIAHASMPTGFEWGGFAVCVAGQRLVVVDVERTDMLELEATLHSECTAFIADLDAAVPPPPGATEASLACLRARWPEHVPTKAMGWVAAIEGGGRSWDPVEWDEAFTNANEQRRAWQSECRDLEVILRHVAQDAGHVVLPGGVQYTIKREGNGERIRRKVREQR